ncbi:DUF523 domain-containing protein [Streptomyces sp. NPDC057336]|uniref:DUF523 domain-containing protein n=1 Tax=Streptomyces sp. NPDC057336 TaxID=3346102 RepID=UPI0036431972
MCGGGGSGRAGRSAADRSTRGHVPVDHRAGERPFSAELPRRERPWPQAGRVPRRAGGCRRQSRRRWPAARSCPFCREVAGGLTTPRRSSRPSAPRTRGGGGAQRLRATAAEALLMPRSPSCGRAGVDDGSFTAELVPGDGVTAALVERNGITVRRAPEL